jgi:hypothetical protein
MMLRSKACFLSPFANHLACICIAFLFGNILLEISDESEIHQRLFPSTISLSSSSLMIMDSFVAVEAITDANDLAAMYAFRSAFNNYTGWMNGTDPCTGNLAHLSGYSFYLSFPLTFINSDYH